MKRTFVISAAAASAFLWTDQGQAQPRIAVQAVSTAGLDLRRERDVRRLDRRIASAAASLCGPMSDADPAGKNAVRRCRMDAAASAVGARTRLIAAQARPQSGQADRRSLIGGLPAHRPLCRRRLW